MNTILRTFLLAGTLAGCLASGRVGYQATVVAPAPAVVVEAPPPPPPPPPQPEVYVEAQPAVEVTYVEPSAFVYVSPEVQVIEDYDYPVFFYGGMYWRNEGGLWYSSSYHDRGWLTVSAPPVYISRIQNPHTYVHYRANVQARPGQVGYRAAVTAPIHHSAPPPRFIEHPGRPVAPPHPVMEGNVNAHGGAAVGHEPPGHMGGALPPGHTNEPPGHEAHAAPPPPVGHEPPGHMGGAVPPPHVAAPPPPPPPPAAHPAPPAHVAPPPPAAHPAPPPPAAHPAPPTKKK